MTEELNSPRNNLNQKKCPHYAYRGSTLVVTVSMLMVLIAFLGVGIFVGLQAYLQSELQKAVNTSVQVGSAAMYTSLDNKLPEIDPDNALSVTQRTFNAIIANSPALRSFNAQATSAPTVNSAERSVSLGVKGSIPTPFLAFTGIRQIDTTAQAKAQALQFRPTDLPDEQIYIRVSGWPIVKPDTSFQRTVTNYPIVDRLGNDIYIKQGPVEKGYQVEACTLTDCYQLGPAAVTPDGSSPWPQPANKNIVQGNVLIDLDKVGVKKAISIKVSDDARYFVNIAGKRFLATNNDDLSLESVSIYGYSALCPSNQPCASVPVGYARY